MEQKFIDIATDLQRNAIFISRYQVRDFYLEARQRIAYKINIDLRFEGAKEYVEIIADNCFMELARQFSEKIFKELLYGTSEMREEPMGILGCSKPNQDERVLLMQSDFGVIGFSNEFKTLVKTPQLA